MWYYFIMYIKGSIDRSATVKKYVLMLAVSMLGLGLAAEPLEVASFAMENKGKVTSPSAGVYRMDGVPQKDLHTNTADG